MKHIVVLEVSDTDLYPFCVSHLHSKTTVGGVCVWFLWFFIELIPNA